MKSLSLLSKFLGCYDRWKSIKEKYQLNWSEYNSIGIFQDIVNEQSNFTVMLDWLKTPINHMPSSHNNILIYCTLTGLRPEEACQSISLIKKDKQHYLNKEAMILEHIRYPEVFIRKTKQAYVSVITNSILQIAEKSGQYDYNALRCYLRRRNIPMHMNYCRKIYATYLRSNGIEQEIIDLLQGRIPKSIFVRHYFRPDLDSLERVRKCLTQLKKLII